MKKTTADLVALFKGLSDPTRLRIIGLLAAAGGELCVCQIEAALGESQYKVSRHLKVLKNCGWVNERREGRWVHYQIKNETDSFYHQLYLALQALPAHFINLKVNMRDLPRLRKNSPCQE